MTFQTQSGRNVELNAVKVEKMGSKTIARHPNRQSTIVVAEVGDIFKFKRDMESRGVKVVF